MIDEMVVGRVVLLLALGSATLLGGCAKYAQEGENTTVAATVSATPSARAHVSCPASLKIVTAPGDGHFDTVAIIGSGSVKMHSRVAVGRDPQLQVTGWATNGDKMPVSAVCAFVDGRVVPGGDFTMDLGRPDVAAAGQASGAATVGYQGTIALHGLTAGNHVVKLGRVIENGVAPFRESLTLAVK